MTTQCVFVENGVRCSYTNLLGDEHEDCCFQHSPATADIRAKRDKTLAGKPIIDAYGNTYYRQVRSKGPRREVFPMPEPEGPEPTARELADIADALIQQDQPAPLEEDEPAWVSRADIR